VVDVFVSAVGTGGTITGVGGFLKQRKPGSASSPSSPPVPRSSRPAGRAARHAGIGGGFIRRSSIGGLIDESSPSRMMMPSPARRGLARDEGILAGVSSGAALHAQSTCIARGHEGKTIVVLLADTGERYVTTRPVSRIDRLASPCRFGQQGAGFLKARSRVGVSRRQSRSPFSLALINELGVNRRGDASCAENQDRPMPIRTGCRTGTDGGRGGRAAFSSAPYAIVRSLRDLVLRRGGRTSRARPHYI